MSLPELAQTAETDYMYSKSRKPLNPSLLILTELADRFYFLRDLMI